MPRHILYKLVVPVIILLMIAVITWWLVHNPVSSFTYSVPGMDKRIQGKQVTTETISVGEDFTFFKDEPLVPGTRWNRFRGSDYDNISKERIPLIDSWGSAGPKILWKKAMGEGHAAPAVYDGRVYILDYDERTKSDALRCLSLFNGEELWNRRYKVHLKRNHGLSRTIPAVNEKYVVSIGPRGHIMCVGRLKGELLWGLDLEKEYDTEIPFWYTGQCPLVENDTAIIAVGGKSLIIGIDCKTGKKVWETPNPKAWKMSHSSLMPMVVNGKKMVVYCAIGGICGISISGSDKGKTLWETSAFSPSVIAPSPLVLDEGKILITAGYGAGSAILQVKENGGSFSVSLLDKFKPAEGIASEQQTPFIYKGHVFGILPKDAGEMRNQFVCYKSGNLKKPVMNSGKTERFGLGPYMVADDKFFILSDDGELTIAKASTSEFKIMSKTRILEGQDSWGPLAITGGYLILRDSKQMICLDIRK